MPPATPSPRAWTLAIAYGVAAYAVHKTGVMLGFYPRFFWFQLLTHFLSASALALLLLVLGWTVGLSTRPLVAFVVVGSTGGALGWELVEYLGYFPKLHWWGIEDSLLDLGCDVLGVATVLGLAQVRPISVSVGDTSAPTDATSAD